MSNMLQFSLQKVPTNQLAINISLFWLDCPRTPDLLGSDRQPLDFDASTCIGLGCSLQRFNAGDFTIEDVTSWMDTGQGLASSLVMSAFITPHDYDEDAYGRAFWSATMGVLADVFGSKPNAIYSLCWDNGVHPFVCDSFSVVCSGGGEDLL